MVLETAAGMVLVVVVEAVVQMKVRGHRLIFSATAEFLQNTLILPKEDDRAQT